MLPPPSKNQQNKHYAPQIGSQDFGKSIAWLDIASATPDPIYNSSIGIISFATNSSHLNYGATLHGYAFQRYLLKTFNVPSTIIDYFPKALNGENLKYPILNKKGKRSIINYLLVKANWLVGFFSNIRKWNKFEEFKRQFMFITSKTYTYNSLKSTKDIKGTNISLFVCEADVIWKISSVESADDNFFLDFPAANGKIKVAYAPTIGSKEFSGDILLYFQQKIKDFYAISAREEIGAKYLTKIINRPVTHTLDPTLLLDEEDYNQILINPKEKDYLLIYNCTVNDIEMVKAAIEYGKQNKLTVIEISNYGLNRFVGGHKVKDDIGVREWLGYINGAKIIFTNSFHGICFSIIFKKDFYVFQRDNTDYRMQDILNSLGIEQRLIPCGNRDIPTSSFPINYVSVYENLEGLRKKSKFFIEKNIIEPFTMNH